MAEPLEEPEQARLAAFPVRDAWSYKFLEKCQSIFWVPSEFDKNLAEDSRDWPLLSADEQRFIKQVLAFFAVSDAVVNETIGEELSARIQPLEIRMVYNYQRMMEDVHNIVYSKLVETYTAGEPEERTRLLESMRHYPAVRAKVEWCRRQRASPASQRAPLARVLFVNCLMEGLFFSGSFCAIFWAGHFLKRLPGLTKANEFISRDEGLHTDFGIHLYRKHIRHPLGEAEARAIMGEAVDLEQAFIAEALPRNLRGMNAALMHQYIKFVADQLMKRLGYGAIFGAANPFPFMQKQSVSVRSVDFFHDPEVTEYGHHAAGLKEGDHQLDFGSAE
jgi:ribonucleotide reductase beta subunit family protein with ferritin-like domain